MNDPVRLLSTHGSVLAAITRRPAARVRDIAEELALTERTVQGAIADLVRDGYVARVRVGRRNHYILHDVGQLPAWTGTARSPDRGAQPPAVVLACSDHRHQAELQRFLVSRSLAGHAELLLWPGGGAALMGPHRETLFDMLRQILVRVQSGELILVSHRGCEVPDVPRVAGASPTATFRATRRWARRIAEHSLRRLRIRPSLWFIDRLVASPISTGSGPADRSAAADFAGR
jgi:hypothetical protein